MAARAARAGQFTPGGGRLRAVPTKGQEQARRFDERARRQKRSRPAEEFTPDGALRRAGVAASEEARATRRELGRLESTLTRTGVLPELGVTRYGVGGLLIFAGGSLLALALLQAALTGRGPAGVEKLLGGLGQGWRKLVDPRDPIVGRAEASPVDPLTYFPAGSPEAAEYGREQTERREAIRGSGSGRGIRPTGRVTFHRGMPIDAAYAATVREIEKRFGVVATSLGRSKRENEAVGGATSSSHLDNAGGDFGSSDLRKLRRLEAWAKRQGFPFVLLEAPDRPGEGWHVHISFWQRGAGARPASPLAAKAQRT